MPHFGSGMGRRRRREIFINPPRAITWTLRHNAAIITVTRPEDPQTYSLEWHTGRNADGTQGAYVHDFWLGKADQRLPRGTRKAPVTMAEETAHLVAYEVVDGTLWCAHGPLPEGTCCVVRGPPAAREGIGDNEH
jgi:hypothetical protein